MRQKFEQVADPGHAARPVCKLVIIGSNARAHNALNAAAACPWPLSKTMQMGWG